MLEKIINDERGIRTPEVASTTGLAILRHTGLGYLVPGNALHKPVMYIRFSLYKVAGMHPVAIILIFQGTVTSPPPRNPESDVCSR